MIFQRPLVCVSGFHTLRDSLFQGVPSRRTTRASEPLRMESFCRVRSLSSSHESSETIRDPKASSRLWKCSRDTGERIPDYLPDGRSRPVAEFLPFGKCNSPTSGVRTLSRKTILTDARKPGQYGSENEIQDSLISCSSLVRLQPLPQFMRGGSSAGKRPFLPVLQRKDNIRPPRSLSAFSELSLLTAFALAVLLWMSLRLWGPIVWREWTRLVN